MYPDEVLSLPVRSIRRETGKNGSTKKTAGTNDVVPFRLRCYFLVIDSPTYSVPIIYTDIDR